MKVLYLSSALTHYYNLVLSRLNGEPSVELVAVVPSAGSAHVGDGVYQTRDGINFRVIELEERPFLRVYSTFRGLARVIRVEQPDAVIVAETHLQPFVLDPFVIRAMKATRSALLMKSIPFRMRSYDEISGNLDDKPRGFAMLPGPLNRLIVATGFAALARRFVAEMYKRALTRPDAHLNYVEAAELWRGYGVRDEQIFVTRNSPDTDLLLGVHDALRSAPLPLALNPQRLLHVGRLVPWKRVDMLIRAFARVKRGFPDAELVIVGTGSEEGALRALVAELDLGTSVCFLGGVYDPYELGRYYLASSVYVLAGMGGLSINEAMCFGRPILCSVCDGTEKVLVREDVNGRYFLDGDEDDLVEKIEWFFANPDRLAEMGRRSEEIIRTEVNIHTVIGGYLAALHYAIARAKGEGRRHRAH